MITLDDFVFGYSGYIDWLRDEIETHYEHIDNIPWDSEFDNFIENMLLDKYGTRIIAKRFEKYTTETQKKNILLTMYAKYAYNWTQLYNAYTTEYDALHNYDGRETEIITQGSQTSQNNNNDIFAFNSNDEQHQSKQDGNITQNGTSTRTLTKGGNLGVTMSQQMIEAEFEYRKLYNFFDIVIQNIADYVTIRIY